MLAAAHYNHLESVVGEVKRDLQAVSQRLHESQIYADLKALDPGSPSSADSGDESITVPASSNAGSQNKRGVLSAQEVLERTRAAAMGVPHDVTVHKVTVSHKAAIDVDDWEEEDTLDAAASIQVDLDILVPISNTQQMELKRPQSGPARVQIVRALSPVSVISSDMDAESTTSFYTAPQSAGTERPEAEKPQSGDTDADEFFTLSDESTATPLSDEEAPEDSSLLDAAVQRLAAADGSLQLRKATDNVQLSSDDDPEPPEIDPRLAVTRADIIEARRTQLRNGFQVVREPELHESSHEFAPSPTLEEIDREITRKALDADDDASGHQAEDEHEDEDEDEEEVNSSSDSDSGSEYVLNGSQVQRQVRSPVHDGSDTTEEHDTEGEGDTDGSFEDLHDDPAAYGVFRNPAAKMLATVRSISLAKMAEQPAARKSKALGIPIQRAPIAQRPPMSSISECEDECDTETIASSVIGEDELEQPMHIQHLQHASVEKLAVLPKMQSASVSTSAPTRTPARPFEKPLPPPPPTDLEDENGSGSETPDASHEAAETQDDAEESGSVTDYENEEIIEAERRRLELEGDAAQEETVYANAEAIRAAEEDEYAEEDAAEENEYANDEVVEDEYANDEAAEENEYANVDAIDDEAEEEQEQDGLEDDAEEQQAEDAQEDDEAEGQYDVEEEEEDGDVEDVEDADAEELIGEDEAEAEEAEEDQPAEDAEEDMLVEQEDDDAPAEQEEMPDEQVEEEQVIEYDEEESPESIEKIDEERPTEQLEVEDVENAEQAEPVKQAEEEGIVEHPEEQVLPEPAEQPEEEVPRSAKQREEATKPAGTDASIEESMPSIQKPIEQVVEANATEQSPTIESIHLADLQSQPVNATAASFPIKLFDKPLPPPPSLGDESADENDDDDTVVDDRPEEVEESEVEDSGPPRPLAPDYPVQKPWRSLQPTFFDSQEPWQSLEPTFFDTKQPPWQSLEPTFFDTKQPPWKSLEPTFFDTNQSPWQSLEPTFFSIIQQPWKSLEPAFFDTLCANAPISCAKVRVTHESVTTGRSKNSNAIATTTKRKNPQRKSAQSLTKSESETSATVSQLELPPANGLEHSGCLPLQPSYMMETDIDSAQFVPHVVPVGTDIDALVSSEHDIAGDTLAGSPIGAAEKRDENTMEPDCTDAGKPELGSRQSLIDDEFHHFDVLNAGNVAPLSRSRSQSNESLFFEMQPYNDGDLRCLYTLIGKKIKGLKRLLAEPRTLGRHGRALVACLADLMATPILAHQDFLDSLLDKHTALDDVLVGQLDSVCVSSHTGGDNLHSHCNLCSAALEKLATHAPLVASCSKFTRVGSNLYGNGVLLFVFVGVDTVQRFLHSHDRMEQQERMFVVYLSARHTKTYLTRAVGKQVDALADLCSLYDTDTQYICAALLLEQLADSGKLSAAPLWRAAIQWGSVDVCIRPAATSRRPAPVPAPAPLPPPPVSLFDDQEDEQDEEEIRKRFVGDVQRLLREHHISLRHSFPEVHAKLAEFGATGLSFDPVVIRFASSDENKCEYECTIRCDALPLIKKVEVRLSKRRSRPASLEIANHGDSTAETLRDTPSTLKATDL